MKFIITTDCANMWYTMSWLYLQLFLEDKISNINSYIYLALKTQYLLQNI
jgi:hypothetical protein